MNHPMTPPLSGVRERTASAVAIDERQTLRRCLRRPVQLRDSGGLKCSAIMVDISETGCQLQFDGFVSIQVGRIYCVKLEGTEALGAYAIWTDRERSGFFFASPLYTAVVEHIAGRATPPRAEPDVARTLPSVPRAAPFNSGRPPRLFAVA